MESHLIITIGRQIGAGGLGVAQLLSQEFGLKVYDKELLAAVARESGLDEACFEKRDEKSSRGVLGALQGFRSMLGMYNRAGTDTVMNEDKLFQIQSEVMRGIAAQEDCIIVGRCSNIILREAGVETFDIFLHADKDFRVRRCEELGEYGKTDPEKFVDRCDHWRETYYHAYTGHTMGNYKDYDISLNVAKLTPQGTIDVLVGILKDKVRKA